MFLYILTAVAALGLTNCIDDSEPASPVMPVIEGWIDSDGYPVVIFTSSIQPDENGTSLADKIIRWGKITISDGEQDVILTGGPSKEFFPPYRYFTFDMKGVPGRTYSITAEYENLYATASCTMPYPTEITSIEFTPIEDSDTLRAATLHFTSPTDCPAYYCLNIRDLTLRRRLLPSMMSTAETLSPGEDISLPLYYPKNSIDTADYIPHFRVGSEIEVELCRVSKEVYDFWKDFDNMVMFGGSQFISGSTSLRGNINGGYGIWSARGSSRRFIQVD